MESSAVNFAIALVRAWLHGETSLPRPPGDVEPLRLLEVIRRNRLEAMSHALLPRISEDGWDQVHAACEDAYRRNLLFGLHQLQAGSDLAARFEAAGVRAIAMRGPFAGADLYGDIGLRRFTDIDLYVPAKQRRAAWNAALAAGYRLVRDGLPRGFFERHHLHWPLAKRDGSTSCDLHWALDHPYKLHHVDYEALFQSPEPREAEGCTWRQPAPGLLLLCAAMHLGKHCREGRDIAFAPDGARRAAERGWLPYWIEVAATIRRYRGELDWDRLSETARAWRVEDVFSAALGGVVALFDSPVPAVSPRRATAAPMDDPAQAPAWVRDVSRLGGFQGNRVDDARAYLFPPADYFRAKTPAGRALRRAAHTAQAAPRLLLASGEALVWPAWAKLTHRGQKTAQGADKADTTVRTGDRE